MNQWSRQAHDLSPGLLRQRRNLLVVSLLLLFTEIAQADFSSVSVMGLQTTFGKPEAVHWFLLAFSAYFAYRYFVYLLQEPSLHLKTEFFRRLDRLSHKKLIAIRNRNFPGAEGAELGGDLSGTRVGRFPKYEMQVNTGKDIHGNPGIGKVEVKLANLWWESLRALLETVVFRSYFTDYILPLVLVFLSWAVIFIKWLA